LHHCVATAAAEASFLPVFRPIDASDECVLYLIYLAFSAALSINFQPSRRCRKMQVFGLTPIIVTLATVLGAFSALLMGEP
jgi:hypothetical protein